MGYASPGWKRCEIDPKTRTFHAKAAVAMTPFVDDVWVEVQPDGEGAVVHVRSRTRMGRGDLGANARRIRTYLASLERYLGGTSGWQ